MTGLGKVTVPEGESGDWVVERFAVDQKGADWHNMRATITGSRRYVAVGEYTRLAQNTERG